MSPCLSVTNSSTTWEFKSSLAVCEDQFRVEMWNSDCRDCSVARCFPCCTAWDRHQNSWIWWHRLSLWLKLMTFFCTNCKSFCWLQYGSCHKTDVKRNRTSISEVMIILTLLSKWWQYFTCSNFMQQILTWRPKEDFEEWISNPACLVRLEDRSGNHQVLSHCSEQGQL